MFNRNDILRCFCSYDCAPLTYTAKRLMFIGRHTMLFLLGIVLNDIVIFSLHIKAKHLYAINFFLAHPLKHLSSVAFDRAYYSIFIYIGTLLEANMDRSLNANLIIYYFLCLVFLVLITAILILACILTTPTNSNNEPYKSRAGLLDKFILEIQLSTIIIDIILSILIFIPYCYYSIGIIKISDQIKGVSIYPILVVGQRYIEKEILTGVNSNSNSNEQHYYNKKYVFYCLYMEYAVSRSFAIKRGWVEESKQDDLTSTVANDSSRVSAVEQTNNPLAEEKSNL